MHYHTVLCGTVQYCTVQYSNKMMILSAEMDSLTLKTYEKTYNMPIVRSFVSYCNLWYSTVLYSTVRYQNCNFKLRNGFLDLKNHRKDIYHDYNVLSLEKNWFLMYSTVQYSTVQYSKINFEFKNGFPDPKNPQNDISHVQI